MSYYDPKTYNYEALNDADKKVIDIYDTATEDALNREHVIGDIMGIRGGEDADYLDKIRKEIAGQVFDAIEEHLAIQRQEMIVSLLDAEAVEEMEV